MQILDRYPLPEIRTRTDLIENLKFVYSLSVAIESLLVMAGMPEKYHEEKGHADWLKRDLEALGETVPVIDHDAAMMAGSQYYYIRHVDPRMLLGYMAAMECRPMPLESVDMLESQYGPLPCLRHHAIADIDHGNEVLLQIDAVENEDLKKKILYNCEQTAAGLQAVLQKRLNHG